MNIIQARLGLPIYTVWQLIILIIGLWGIKRLWLIFCQSKLLVFSGFFFLGFVFLAIVSTLAGGNSIPKAALFQIISNCKLILVLAFGLYMSSKVNINLLIERAIWIFIFLVTIFLFLQWLAPSTYLAILNVSKIPVEDTGIFPSPGLSIFSHPSILAATSATLAIYCFAKLHVLGQQLGQYRLKFIGLTFLLIASNQRQEIFAFLLVVLGIYVVGSRGLLIKRLFFTVIISVTIFLIFVIVFGETFQREASMWGIGSYHASTHPRAQLYEGAEYIAREYFPLGSGLGTFGGVGSLKYDLSLYYKLGFSHFWWWSDYEGYLLDTYWTNALAESGFIGAALLLTHYLLFAIYLIYQAVVTQEKQIKMIWLSTAGCFLWVLLVTPTSPGFQEILLLYFPALLFGLAVSSNQGVCSK